MTFLGLWPAVGEQERYLLLPIGVPVPNQPTKKGQAFEGPWLVTHFARVVVLSLFTERQRVDDHQSSEVSGKDEPPEGGRLALDAKRFIFPSRLSASGGWLLVANQQPTTWTSLSLTNRS